MVVARYTYTERDALEASRHIIRATVPWLSFLPWIGAVMTAGMAYVWIVQGIPPWQGLNPSLVGPLFCMMPWFTRRGVLKNFRQSPEAGREQTWRIDEESLAIETSGAATRFDWTKLVRAKETKHGFLLFTQPKLAHWLPMSAFASRADIDLFREYIRQSPIPKKG